MELAKYLDFFKVGEANMNTTKSDEPLLTAMPGTGTPKDENNLFFI